MGQSSHGLPIHFDLRYDGISLNLTEAIYKANDADSTQIETLKFYISKGELNDQNKRIFAENDSYHLIDAANESSLNFNLAIPKKLKFTYIQFQLGIDSLTNIAGAMGGDLDPTKGMYWTWQSGYINFKLEGKSSLF